MTTRILKVLVLDQARGVWGAQRYLLRLAPLLRERGIELSLAGSPSLELYGAWRDAGLPAVPLDLPVDRSIRSSGRPSPANLAREARTTVTMARRIAEVARRGDYDALWANAHWTHLDAALAGRLCGKPVVLHLHEEPMPGLGQWLRGVAVQLATQSVAVSQAVATGLPRSVRRRVTVIPNGVDTEAMSPPTEDDVVLTRGLRESFGVADDEVLVLAATRLDPSKRIEDLIAAVETVDDPRIRLLVAGSTSGFPEYERSVRVKAEGLRAGSVTFCGNRNDMPSLFRASDLVIHAGVVEGMPLGLIESQACGKPVIAYDVAGVSEAVQNRTTGLLAPPRDVASLTNALRRLAGDPHLRAEMGLAARSRVLRHHRIDVQADRNVTVLNDVCAVPAV